MAEIIVEMKEIIDKINLKIDGEEGEILLNALNLLRLNRDHRLHTDPIEYKRIKELIKTIEQIKKPEQLKKIVLDEEALNNVAEYLFDRIKDYNQEEQHKILLTTGEIKDEIIKRSKEKK